MSGGLVLRAPNHLGDLIMAMPSVLAARPDAVVLPGPLAALLPMAGVDARVIPLARGTRGLLAAVAPLRRGRFARGVLLTPSFSSALLFRLGGVSRTTGTDTDRRRVLLHDPVPRASVDGLHRTERYWRIALGQSPAARPVPRLEVPESLLGRWRAVLRAERTPVIGVFPGSNAPARRWDAERFAALVRQLSDEGAQVVVFGAAHERELTRFVAGEGGFDAGGRTSVALLAAALRACHILISNDTGPMHLAAAVGTPTVSIWGPGDPDTTGPTGAAHTLVRRADLPCVPCVRNECPRRGHGTFLPEASRECMKLITVENVLTAIRASVKP